MRETPVTRRSLLARVRSTQDAEAWRLFEAMYAGLIVRYCAKRGLQLADAEDIQQSVLAKLARSLRNFEYDPARGRFRSYLGRCVRNAIYSAASHKAAVATVSLDDAGVAPTGEDASDQCWHKEWVDHHLRQAMTTLRAATDERTLAVFDAILQGKAYEQISAEFGVSPALVRKVKQRIRDRLQDIVARQVNDEELPSAERGPS